MRGKSPPRRVRLNYVIDAALDAQLATYCERTGRIASAVVRQLVIEWLEGDRRLPTPAREHPAGRRTNLQLSPATKVVFETRIVEEGHSTGAAVIHALLAPFLVHRAGPSKSKVSVLVPVSADRFDELFIFCERWGWSVSDGLAILARDPEAIERLAKFAIEVFGKGQD